MVKMNLDIQKGVAKTAINLYQGHDADSLVEEWYHDFYEHTDEKERAQLLYTIIIFISFIIIIVGTVVYFNHAYFGSWIIQNKKYGLLLFYTYCGWSFLVINDERLFQYEVDLGSHLSSMN